MKWLAAALLAVSCTCATTEVHDELYLLDPTLLVGQPGPEELLSECRRSSDQCAPLCRRFLRAILQPFVEVETIERCELIPAADREALRVRYLVRLCPREMGPGAPIR
jgi:hypothetical protein